MSTASKVRSPADALAWRQQAGKPVVFTNGVFDLLHLGHVTLLEQAAQIGASLIVAVNADLSVRALGKGADRPIVPDRDRASVVAALGCVDCVVIFEEPTPITLIELLRPDILVKGGDYRPDQIVGADVVLGYGGRIEIIPFLPDRSTTRTLERLRAPS